MNLLKNLIKNVLNQCRFNTASNAEPLISDFVATTETSVPKSSGVDQPTRNDGYLSDSTWSTEKESDYESDAVPKRKHVQTRKQLNRSLSSDSSSSSEYETVQRSSSSSSSTSEDEHVTGRRVISSRSSSSSECKKKSAKKMRTISSSSSRSSKNENVERTHVSSSEFENENVSKTHLSLSSHSSYESKNEKVKKTITKCKAQPRDIYNKTAFQSMCPKSNFAGHLLLAQTVNNTLVTDIGNIIYAQGYPRMRLEELTEAFCDNIMLVTFRDTKTHLDESRLPRVRVKTETITTINAQVKSIFSAKLTSFSGKYVRSKIPYKLSNCNLANEFQNANRPIKNRKRQVETALSREILLRMEKKYPDTLVIPVKVSLADVSLRTTIDALTSVVHLLRAEDYFVIDIDVTQDNKGIFIKSELREYLIREHGFRMENDTAERSDVTAWYNRSWNPVLKNDMQDIAGKVFDPTDYDINPDNYEIPRPIIRDDDHTEGLDCLSWVYLNTRVKVYNKFVCEMTSPGVAKTLGNHIVDMITPSTARLAETLKCGVKEGVTRLEITIYCPTVEADSAEDLYTECMGMIDINKSHIANAPFYKVPLSAMWSRLCSELKSSCTVVVDDEMLVHAYWANSRTRKITSTCWELNRKDREKLINYAITGLSFDDLPAYLLRVITVPEEDLDARRHTENIPLGQSYVYIDQSCFFKKKSGARTFFTRSDTPYTMVGSVSNIIPVDNIYGEGLPHEPPDEEHVDFYNAGLVDTPHVKPTVHRKSINNDSEIAPCGYIKVDRFPKFLFKPRPLWVSQYSGNSKSYGKGKKNTEEILPGPTEEEIRDIRNNLQAEYEERMELEAKLKRHTLLQTKEQQLLLHQFDFVQFKNLNYHAFYRVYAFIVKQDMYPSIGVLASEQLNRHMSISPRRVFHMKGLYKKKFIDMAQDRLNFEELGYSRVLQTETNYPIVYVVGDEPMVTFDTSGKDSYQGHTYAKVQNLTWKMLKFQRPQMEKLWENIKNIVPTSVGEIKQKYDDMNKGYNDDNGFVVESNNSDEDRAIDAEARIKRAVKQIPDDMLKPKLYTDMNDLKPGTYTVVAMSSIKRRGNRKFVMQLEARANYDEAILNRLYLSNFWFEQEFQRMCSIPSRELKARVEGVITRVDTHKIFDIHMGEFKRTPGRKPSRIVVIAGHKIGKNKKSRNTRKRRRLKTPSSSSSDSK